MNSKFILGFLVIIGATAFFMMKAKDHGLKKKVVNSSTEVRNNESSGDEVENIASEVTEAENSLTVNDSQESINERDPKIENTKLRTALNITSQDSSAVVRDKIEKIKKSREEQIRKSAPVQSPEDVKLSSMSAQERLEHRKKSKEKYNESVKNSLPSQDSKIPQINKKATKEEILNHYRKFL